MKIKIEYKKENSLFTRVIFIEVDGDASTEEIQRDVHDAILDDLDVSMYKWEKYNEIC